MVTVARIALAPGYSIARLINGGWQLAAGHTLNVQSTASTVDGLSRLVDAGFTTFDCADIYTGVESLLGRVVARARARGERVEVHTKLVPDRAALPALDRAYVTGVIDRSLRRLGVEQLDLVQLHWWDYAVPGLVETGGWLDQLRQDGKIRLIGVTNLDVPHLRALIDAGLPIASHQLQYSLLDRRPVDAMAAYCREHGVALLAYGSLAGGFLTDRWRGRDDPGSPLDNRSLVKYRLIIDECGGWSAFQALLEDARVVANRHGVSIAALATRWVLDQDGVAAAIVGTRGDAHLDDRRRSLALVLDAEDRARLNAALADLRSPPGSVYGLERVEGGRHAVIMKTDLNRLDS